MITKIFGWGRSLFSYSKIETLSRGSNALVYQNPRGISPRGLGRSYGDSAINSGGTALDSRALKQIDIDPVSATAKVGAGVTFLELENESINWGFFPIVVPGTAFVTIGGAIASDIHGKSHHRIGSISEHLISIDLLTSDGLVRKLKPSGETSDLFWATVGGMGLTGMIVEAVISLMAIESAFVNVIEKRVKNFEDLLTNLIELNSSHIYTVAWVDLSGRYLGRGIVSAANHSNSADISPRLASKVMSPKTPKKIKIPQINKIKIINKFTIRIFNSVWYYKPLGKKIQHIQKFMHPLDGIQNWNAIYGDKGFVQYQFVIPLNKTSVLKEVIYILRVNSCSSFLTVLKSLGKDSRALIGFPIQGWTLAIDFHLGQRNLMQVLEEIDKLVMSAGGRVYLTKDSRLSHKCLESMYPKLNEWKKIKRSIDPDNNWQSDQGRRLKLC